MAFGKGPGITAMLVLLLATPAAAEATNGFDATTYQTALTRLESQRVALHERLRTSRSAAKREAIRKEARATVLAAITDLIFPAWLGTPWGLGPTSTALFPHEAGKVVGCSYFVTGVLMNAGLRLSSRARFAQAPSLMMQQALAPDQSALHRFASLPADTLTRRVLALGDGVYLVGLNIHTGFLVVKDGQVRIVHASYTSPNQVVDEALASSRVIALSRTRGYVVTPIFRDARLLDLWLSGQPVPAPTWRPR